MSRSNREIAKWVVDTPAIPEELRNFIRARVGMALEEKDLACEREIDLARSGGFLEGQRA